MNCSLLAPKWMANACFPGTAQRSYALAPMLCSWRLEAGGSIAYSSLLDKHRGRIFLLPATAVSVWGMLFRDLIGWAVPEWAQLPLSVAVFIDNIPPTFRYPALRLS